MKYILSQLNINQKVILLSIVLGLITLFSFSTHTHADDSLENPKRDTYIDYIAIDNEIVEIDENDNIYIDKQDTIKISGFGQPDSIVTIEYNDDEIESEVNEYGSWFVLLSVSSLNDGVYPVEFKAKNDSLTICNLVLGDNVFPNKESVINKETSEGILKYGIILLAIGAVASLSFYIGYKKSPNRRK